MISVSDTLVVVSFCSLWDERLRIHANDDWCGLNFPVFYTVTAKPHIVDVISVSHTLVVDGVIVLFLFVGAMVKFQRIFSS